jgi:ABC-type Fe3+-hydroxamate transport system substrate-binding protein
MKKLLLFLLAGFLLAGCAGTKNSTPVSEDPENINAIVVGDRAFDTVLSLGYMPEAVSVRASQWDKPHSLPVEILGCPVKTTIKLPELLPDYIEMNGIEWVIIEKNSNFCRLMEKAKPGKMAEILKDVDVRVDVVDFSDGLETGIMETAALFGKEKEGKALYKQYERDLTAAQAGMTDIAPGQKVVALRAVLKKKTGRLFVTAESKGFYLDKEFLEPFGCENVGDLLNDAGNELTKGYFPVMNLNLLAEAAPDAIVLYGPAKNELKEKILEIAAVDEDVAAIPAVSNGRIATSLPYYVGSDIAEYPSILEKWIDYFSAK